MAISSFLNQKIERRFERLDLDGNGYVDEADFEQAARRMGKAFGLADEDPKLTWLVEIMSSMWANLSALADSDHDGRVSREEYKAAFVRLILADQQAFTRVYTPFIRALMAVADKDGDGRLQLDEYTLWYETLLGVRREEAEEAFRRLDRDGDGYVTGDEILEAVTEYYFSEDPEAPGNWLLGRP